MSDLVAEEEGGVDDEAVVQSQSHHVVVQGVAYQHRALVRRTQGLHFQLRESPITK